MNYSIWEALIAGPIGYCRPHDVCVQSVLNVGLDRIFCRYLGLVVLIVSAEYSFDLGGGRFRGGAMEPGPTAKLKSMASPPNYLAKETTPPFDGHFTEESK